MLAFSNIDMYFVNFCAPCLAGLKPANFFSLPQNVYEKSFINARLMELKGLSIKLLYRYGGRVYVFLYRKAFLEKVLLDENIKKALKIFGYEDFENTDKLLDKLARRLRFFNECGKKERKLKFPHEIGLFLGYPCKDVMEYYKNEGKGYIFSGYWKVYSNPKEAAKVFRKFNECKTFFSKKIKSGCDIYSLISA